MSKGHEKRCPILTCHICHVKVLTCSGSALVRKIFSGICFVVLLGPASLGITIGIRDLSLRINVVSCPSLELGTCKLQWRVCSMWSVKKGLKNLMQMCRLHDMGRTEVPCSLMEILNQFYPHECKVSNGENGFFPSSKRESVSEQLTLVTLFLFYWFWAMFGWACGGQLGVDRHWALALRHGIKWQHHVLRTTNLFWRFETLISIWICS